MLQHNLNAMGLSRLANIPQPTLHHLLSGKTKKPRALLIKKLAQFFNISILALLESDIANQPLIQIINLPILSWNQETLSFHEQPVREEGVYGAYPNESFAFHIYKKFCHSPWPNQSLAILAKNASFNDATYGLVYFKKYGLILNKIHKEKDNFFIKYQGTGQDSLLLKINLEEAQWFGKLLELRLIGQALTDYL